MANTVSIVVRVRDATARGLSTVGSSLNWLTQAAAQADRSVGSLKGNALTLAPALMPVAAAAAPIAASLGAATAAVGAFGAAVIPQISAMSDAAEAETKYEEAVTKHGKASKEAAQAENAYLSLVKEMPPATRKAAASFSVLKDDFDQWSDSLSGDTMPVFTKSFAAFSAMLPKMSPLARTASNELDRLVTIAAGGIAGPGFDAFMGKLNRFAESSMRRATDGLLTFIRAAQSGNVGGNLRQFMDYARSNGPLVGETMRNVGQALLKLLSAASEVGAGILQVVNAFARLVASLPTSLIATLLQVYAAFKLIRLGAAGFSAVSAGIVAVTTQITAMRTAAAGATGRMAGLRAAMGAMSTGAKFGVAAAAAVLLAVGVKKLTDRFREAPPNVEALERSLVRFSQTGKVAGEASRLFGKNLSGFGEAVTRVAHPGVLDRLNDGLHKLVTLGFDTNPALSDAREKVQGFDKALGNLVSKGHADIAAAAFHRYAQAAGKGGTGVAKLRAQLPEYRKALANAKMEEQLAAQSMGLFGEQAIRTKSKLDSQKQSADGLRQAIQALNDVNRQGLGGMIGFEAAIDAAAKAARENAGALSMTHGELNLNSEKARSAATALQDLAQKTDEAAGAARESGRSWGYVNSIYDRGRAKLVAAAMQMGLTRAEAKKLAGQILKTPDKTARLKGNLEDLAKKVKSARERIKSVPASKRSSLKGTIADLEAKVRKAKRDIKSVPPSKRSALRATIADLQAKVRAAKRAIGSVRGKTVTIRTNYVTNYSRTKGATFGRGGSYRRAHGGVIGAGHAAEGGPRSRLTWVGEQGPELLDLPVGSRVRTNGDSERIARTGGGSGEPVVLELASAGSRLDDLLLEVLRKSIRVRGGNVQLVLGGRP